MGKKIGNFWTYLAVAGCTILVIVNVVGFMLMPVAFSAVWVLVSNILTIAVLLIGRKQIASLLDSLNRNTIEKEIRKDNEVQHLRDGYRDVKDELETWKQAKASGPIISFSKELVMMKYDKSGYIVKEEPYQEEEKNTVISRLRGKFMSSGEKKLFYVGKHYLKANIGIDFAKIKYTLRGDKIVFSGLEITKLDNLEIKRDPNEVSHCWVISNGKKIDNSESAQEHCKSYLSKEAELSRKVLEEEVNMYCKKQTESFQRRIRDYFNNVDFCEDINGTTESWYSLNESPANSPEREIASQIGGIAYFLTER